MSQKWSYNNIEFEVALQDADFAEKYEKAFERMGQDEKKVQKAGNNSELIRGYCGLFHNLFDDIYGAGTAKRLFDGKMNAGMCDLAYAAFMGACMRCNEEAVQQRGQLMSRYAPRQNRQQRRNNQQRNKNWNGGQRA